MGESSGRDLLFLQSIKGKPSLQKVFTSCLKVSGITFELIQSSLNDIETLKLKASPYFRKILRTNTNLFLPRFSKHHPGITQTTSENMASSNKAITSSSETISKTLRSGTEYKKVTSTGKRDNNYKKLTPRLCLLIRMFLKKYSVNPEKFPHYGSDDWVLALTELLKTAGDVFGICPADVRNWMAVESIFTDSKHEYGPIGARGQDAATANLPIPIASKEDGNVSTNPEDESVEVLPIEPEVDFYGEPPVLQRYDETVDPNEVYGQHENELASQQDEDYSGLPCLLPDVVTPPPGILDTYLAPVLDGDEDLPLAQLSGLSLHEFYSHIEEFLGDSVKELYD
ncbi:unnamed protein product [Orchesella dallaii]|uniref:Uncharacterized protein n=1 Tax=Orchesella dallaii TaxID=48710 RepID=A0ABP1R9H1_9HEXA